MWRYGSCFADALCCFTYSQQAGILKDMQVSSNDSKPPKSKKELKWNITLLDISLQEGNVFCDYFLAPSLQILLDSNNPESIALVHLQMIYENQTY